jgi:hypothetical protein
MSLDLVPGRWTYLGDVPGRAHVPRDEVTARPSRTESRPTGGRSIGGGRDLGVLVTFQYGATAIRQEESDLLMA